MYKNQVKKSDKSATPKNAEFKRKNELPVEKYVKRLTEKRGGICLKLTNLDGIMDRGCFFPFGLTVFFETKALRGMPTKQQLIRIREFQAKGFDVYVPKDRATVLNAFIHIDEELEKRKSINIAESWR